MIFNIHSKFDIQNSKVILFTSLLILFFIMSCTTDEKKASPIDKQKMQAVLVDMYIAQAASQFSMVTKDSLLLAHKSHYYQQIFDRHNITEETYETAYNWYTKNPDEMHDVYDKVVEILTKLEAINQE